MATVKKIGILGGSFNPAHSGHLEISKTVLSSLCLNQIWWVITSNNPFKDKSIYAPLQTRINQANQIIGDNRIVVREFESEIDSSHTIDLINYLQAQFKHNFVWIMGADNLSHFYRWRGVNDIISSVKIAICNRPNYALNHNDLQAKLHCDTNLIFTGKECDFMDKLSPNVIYIKSTNNNTSSTDIREGGKENNCTKGLKYD